MKELSLHIELCAYMLATVLERHVISAENEICYFTAEELASEANSYNTEMSSEFCVLEAAVHQGMRIFKKGLESNGFVLDILYPTSKGMQAMAEFGALRSFNNGWKVKFTYTKELDDATLRERILKRRDSLLGSSLYKTSEYNDIRLIIHEMHMAIPDESFQSPPQVVKHRKKFSELGKRQMNDIVDEVINKVNSEYSSDGLDSNVLMKTIIKVAGKKQKTYSGIVNNLRYDNADDIEEDDIEENVNETNNLMDLNESPQILDALEKIKEKKINYSEQEKKTVIDLFEKVKFYYEDLGSTQSYYYIASRVKELLLNYSGYCSLVPQNIRNWYIHKDKNNKKRGKKVVEAFEAEVLGNVMICIMEKQSEDASISGQSARISLNVAYSYAILAATALDVQKEEKWLSNAAVQKLQCSNKWVRNFLTRSGMRKRKITRDDKKIPAIADIIAKMKEGQAMYIRFGHSPGNTWNMDETCVTWAIGPVHMYVPADQQRASNIGIPNTKLRITAVLTVNGLGEFAPIMFIIKHSVSSENKPDQSTMKVIKNLYERNARFGNANGWELLLWSKTMTIKSITADHKCWYLRHKTTHHIITSQYKAWNDTVRMMMWIELVINPMKERDVDKKLLLWFDNCGCHKTAAIEHIMSELGINVACLPPNMTAILQVLDLVVNGPLKAHIRNNRANKIVKCFKEYKVLFDENARRDVNERVVLNFVAPKPDMMECVDNLIQLFGPDGDFQKQKFKNGVISSFIKTGTTPCSLDENGVPNFVDYKEESICGTMKVVPLGTQPSDFFDIPILPVIAMNDESTEILNAVYALLDREDFGDAEDDEEYDEVDDEMEY